MADGGPAQPVAEPEPAGSEPAGPQSGGSESAGPQPARRRGDLEGWDGYCVRWAALHGGVDPRRSSMFVRSWLRLAYLTGRGLAMGRVAPDVVTAAGLVLSFAVPLVALFRGGWLFIAAGLVVLAALADSADGAVAVLTRRSSRLGSYRDSVADRLSEAAWLLALWLVAAPGTVVGAPGILVTLCGALAWLHEYMRARAATSGMSGIGVITVAERPTRVILVVAALALGGVAWMISPRLAPGAVTVVLAFWALLHVLGAVKLNGAIRAALRG